MIDAVIFDCDGTLVDSEPLSRAAWDMVLEPHGYVTSDDTYPDLVGRSYAHVHAFFSEHIDGLPGREPLWAAYSDALFTLIDVRLEPFVDALDTLGELRSRGVHVAVASSSMRERLVVSAATVKSHVNHIFAKAGVRDRAQAVVYAYEHGLAEPGTT